MDGFVYALSNYYFYIAYVYVYVSLANDKPLCDWAELKYSWAALHRYDLDCYKF